MILSRRSLMVGAASVPLAIPARVGRADTPAVTEHVLGDPAAPVTMIEYSSLTCPHCASFHTDTLPGLEERFIEPGKLKLVMRDFPLDQLALQAAVLAHCAGDERYFTFLNAMFANQQRWGRADDPLAALTQLAMAGGLSRDRIEACLADQEMEEAVLAMRLAGEREFEIRSTPTFIINGTSYPGNRTVDEFAQIIEPLLPEG
jgi:protein-disulfide isomerase